MSIVLIPFIFKLLNASKMDKMEFSVSKVWFGRKGALERNSKNVVSFNVGKRTNKTLSNVVDSLKLSEAKKIFTDRLKNYRYLIDEILHLVKRFGTNHIERKNLTLRIHLKGLNRRTICFSKSLVVLVSVVKIYFWI